MNEVSKSERYSDHYVYCALERIKKEVMGGIITSREEAENQIRELEDGYGVKLLTDSKWGTGDESVDEALGQVLRLLPFVDRGVIAVQTREKLRFLIERGCSGPRDIKKQIREIKAGVSESGLSLEDFGIEEGRLEEMQRAALIETGRRMLKGLLKSAGRSKERGMESLNNFLQKNNLKMGDIEENK